MEDAGLSIVNDICWVVFTTFFTIYYIVTFKRQGITMFGYHMLLSFYMPVCVMYPFAFDAQNVISLGGQTMKVLQYADEAESLTFLSTGLMLLGYFISTRRRHKETKKGLLVTTYQTIVSGWQSKTGLALTLLILIGTTGIFIAQGVTMLNGRQLAMENESLRPLFNMWSVLVGLFAVNAFTAGMYTHSRSKFALGLLICVIGLMGGTRSASVAPAMQAFIIYAIVKRIRRVSVVVGFATAFIALALVIGIMRSQVADSSVVNDQTMIDSMLYGNNFSDLRDFAWVLSGFKGDYYYGKTYLAGYLGFIPSSLLHFREEYGIGKITTNLADIEGLHGGLRITQFGEVYLNFGILGFFIICPIFGYCLERINHWVHWNIIHRSDLNPYVVCMAGGIAIGILSTLTFTSGFYSTYIAFLLWVVGAAIASSRFKKAPEFSEKKDVVI